MSETYFTDLSALENKLDALAAALLAVSEPQWPRWETDKEAVRKEFIALGEKHKQTTDAICREHSCHDELRRSMAELARVESCALRKPEKAKNALTEFHDQRAKRLRDFRPSADAVAEAERIQQQQAEATRAREEEARDNPVPPAAVPASDEFEVRPENRHALAEAGEFTDAAMADRFADMYRHVLRYVPPWKSWLYWDRTRWAVDQTGVAVRYAEEMMRRMINATALLPDAARIDRLKAIASMLAKKRIDAMLGLAKSKNGVPITTDKLDAHPMALNVRNGTLDLTTGQLRPHQCADMLTKICPVTFDPSAECPRWLQFVDEVFEADAQLVQYVQRWAGYCLTGKVYNHVLPIFWGGGGNGKGTLLETLRETLGGDYSMEAEPGLLVSKKNQEHSTGVADLHGKRLVVCSETDDGRRMAEGLVKRLTGGDKLRVRRLYENYWEINPTHKLILQTNHKPKILGTDHGIWRRVRLVPFTVTFQGAKEDHKLRERLHQELPGILNWCLRGCLDWQQHGLPDAPAVENATREYRTEQDTLKDFLAECCVTGSHDYRIQKSALANAYGDWCKKNQEEPMNRTAFGRALSEAHNIDQDHGRRFYLGVALRTSNDEARSREPGDDERRGEWPDPSWSQ